MSGGALRLRDVVTRFGIDVAAAIFTAAVKKCSALSMT
jgi:hypothetical protein